MVRTILRRIETEGEAAVREYSRTLDKWDPADFRVGPDEVEKAKRQLSPVLLDDIHTAKARIEDFARRQLESIRAFEARPCRG
jgi:sulfopropanediol 3-dehydrogenase